MKGLGVNVNKILMSFFSPHKDLGVCRAEQQSFLIKALSNNEETRSRITQVPELIDSAG